MKRKKITKAVIAAAGLGTRLLPATKAMPKEMLPIIDKPAIQYIAEDLVKAGIQEIIMVTSWQKRALEDHFDISPELERALREAGKAKELKEIQRISKLAHFIYLRQKQGKGNGIPALEAAPIVGEEPFLYVFGDDLIQAQDNSSFLKSMINLYQKTGCPVMLTTPVPPSELPRFGVVAIRQENRLARVIDIVEKPKPKEAPSNLAVIGYYILTPNLTQILRATKPGKGGELWLTDALKRYLKKEKLYALSLKEAAWYTVGEPLSYLETILAFAIRKPELKKVVRRFVQRHRL